MSNLDKDIEIEFVKEKIEECTRIIQSVPNMESKKSYSKERTKFKKVLNLIKKKDKELKTWKKIAEKLALGCKQLFKECPLYCEEVCEERKAKKKTCVECLIDWAKREVENEFKRSN